MRKLVNSAENREDRIVKTIVELLFQSLNISNADDLSKTKKKGIVINLNLLQNFVLKKIENSISF